MKTPLRLAAAAILALAGCAKVGTLERPEPLVGARAKAQYQAEKAAAARAQARNPDNGQPEPLPDPNDPATWSAPIKGQQVPGSKASPFGAAPAGVLPQPLTQPDSNGPL